MSLRDDVRAYLGTDRIPHLEDHMTTMIQLLSGLAAQQQEASASQQASFVNLHNAMNRLEEQVAALQAAVTNGDVSPEVQTAADQISTALADMKKAADTADDGFEPVPTDPNIPAGPVDPGTEPTSPDVPAQDTTVPGDETGPTVRSNRR